MGGPSFPGHKLEQSLDWVRVVLLPSEFDEADYRFDTSISMGDRTKLIDQKLAEERVAIGHQIDGAGIGFVWGYWHVGHPGNTFFIELAKTHWPEVAAIIGAWLHGRSGRSVSIKFGDVEVKANSTKELERLLQLAFRTKAESSLPSDEGAQ